MKKHNPRLNTLEIVNSPTMNDKVNNIQNILQLRSYLKYFRYEQHISIKALSGIPIEPPNCENSAPNLACMKMTSPVTTVNNKR